MTYKELYESAADKLEKSKITLGEFEKMIEPLNAEIDTDSDTISRQAAIDAMSESLKRVFPEHRQIAEKCLGVLPSAQPEQRYTEEELMVFQHGISLSLLSKRSSQHWQYDEDTATEIKFLERLYEKVVADMRGEQDDKCRQV